MTDDTKEAKRGTSRPLSAEQERIASLNTDVLRPQVDISNNRDSLRGEPPGSSTSMELQKRNVSSERTHILDFMPAPTTPLRPQPDKISEWIQTSQVTSDRSAGRAASSTPERASRSTSLLDMASLRTRVLHISSAMRHHATSAVPYSEFAYRVYGETTTESVIEHPILPLSEITGETARSVDDMLARSSRLQTGTLYAPNILFIWLSWLALTLFGALEVWLILVPQNGPFVDEAISTTAGIRTLYGFGLGDNYLTWFAGSLLWPVTSGLGYTLAGLEGSRLIALLCVLVAGWGCVNGARNLFGDRAALWTAITLVINGPFLALAHLAVYDVLSLAGIGISFWAVTALPRHDHRGWVIVAAIAFGFAILAEYPTALCIIPLAALLFALRGKRAWLDLGIFGFIFVALLLAYFLPLRSPLTQFFFGSVQNGSSFGVTPAMVNFTLVYYVGLPCLLAFPSVFLARKVRWVAVSLFGALFLWPAYHELTANSASASKHIVFGFLFGYPLIGLMLAYLWTRRGRLPFVMLICRGAALAVLVALLYIGAVQMTQLDRGWVDTRSAVDYMVHNVQPGQHVLSSDSWPYQLALYTHARLASPWDIYDAYAVEHSARPVDLCGFNWFIDEQNGFAWPESLRQRILNCGTFHLVYQHNSTVTNLSRNLTFVTYQVTIEIWSNALPT